MLSASKLAAASAFIFSSIASVSAAGAPGGAIDPTQWYALWNNGQNFLSVDLITNPSDNNTHFLIGFFAPEYVC